MPVSKDLLEEARRDDGVDMIGDTRARGVDDLEAVFVSPRPKQPRWNRPPPVTGEDVDEACRRIVVPGLMLGRPPQPTGKRQHGTPIGQRRRLCDDADRLPRRQQSLYRAGAP